MSDRILIIDDIEENRKLLAALLRKNGYSNLDISDSGKTAFESLKVTPDSELPALILLDVMMPHVDGFELTRRLKEDDRLRLIPVVLVTALNSMEDRLKGIEAGCDDFISKPFDINEILARVKNLIQIGYFRAQLDERGKVTSLLETLSDGILICDASWTVKSANASAVQFLGDIMGKPFFEAIPIELKPRIAATELMDSSQAKLVFDLVREATENRSALYLETIVDKVKRPDGKIASMVITIRDETQRRLDALTKDDVLNLMSHKLRTAVHLIADSSQLITELDDVATIKTVATTLTDQSGKLKGLVDRLFAFTELQKTLRQMPTDEVDLMAYVDGPFQNLVQRYNCDVTNTVSTGTILLSEAHLTQLLTEVLDNASKFSGSPAMVMISGTASELIIQVTDSGPGIPSEEVVRVTEPFYQVEKEFTGNVAGVGLGLAIAKQLTMHAGGDMAIIPGPNGTAVKLIFPVKQTQTQSVTQ